MFVIDLLLVGWASRSKKVRADYRRDCQIEIHNMYEADRRREEREREFRRREAKKNGSPLRW